MRNDTYISEVYFGVAEKVDELDEIIKNCSLKWKLERISRVSMSILRIAVYELLYMSDIPNEVSINEAVEMAKKYDSDDSYTFVNGVLGAVVTNILPERGTANE
ncbi:MAG: transcription antitermination factor NusB [Clostridia bacterium]|nr:transcription antitermination factor NusB [Clostridia bacterium]